MNPHSEFRRAKASHYRYLAGVTLFLVGMLALSVYDAIYLPHRGMYLLAIVLVSLLLWWLSGELRTPPRASLIPYFNAPLEGATTNGRGHSILDNYDALERHCEILGLRPFSSFGFRDGLKGERPSWYTGEEVLHTVTGLLLSIRAKPRDFTNWELLLSDFEAMEGTFHQAGRAGVLVAFVWDWGMGGNSMVWEMRGGTPGGKPFSAVARCSAQP